MTLPATPLVFSRCLNLFVYLLYICTVYNKSGCRQEDMITENTKTTMTCIAEVRYEVTNEGHGYATVLKMSIMEVI